MRRGRRITVVALRRRAWLVYLLVVGALGLLPACDWPWSSPATGAVANPSPTSSLRALASPGPLRIRFLADNEASIGLQLDREAAAEFSRQTGVEVDVIAGPATTTDRLAKSELYLMAESPEI